MQPPEINDPLDALLRENEDYIEDAGFTARVVQALPRRKRSLRLAILLTVTVAGFALMMWWLPSVSVLANVVGEDPQGTVFVELSRNAVAVAAFAAVAGASLLWSLYAALKWED